MKRYPYQNIDLKNIKGEYWKNIPEFEMYFKVSNYGRIKRLEYELEYSDGRIFVKPEKIIKPVVVKVPNRFMNDHTFFLRITITLYKRRYNYSLARLVYHCFKKPMKIDDDSIVILTRDGNGLNIKPSNLKLASLSEKQKRIFDLSRREPLVVEEEARKRAIAKLILTKSKQVTQYSMQGKKIRTYKSAAVAAGETGINPSHISNRASGNEFSAGGFIWRFGKASRVDITPMLEKIAQRSKNNKEAFGKKVTQYKMNGERVAVYPTINDAAKATGIKNVEISRIMQNKRFSAGGFYWKKGHGPAMIDLSCHLYGEVLRAKNRQRPVKQYSIDGKYLQTFNRVNEAANAVGVNSNCYWSIKR